MSNESLTNDSTSDAPESPKTSTRNSKLKETLITIWSYFCGFSIGDFLFGVVLSKLPHFDWHNETSHLACKVVGLAIFFGILKLAGKEKRVLYCTVVTALQIGFLLIALLMCLH